jgi:hypothetical protein
MKISKRWHYLVNILCSTFGCLVLGLIFFPGLYSQDSVHCIAQALNLVELDNWHPILFTLLIKPTIWGQTSYFILLQTAVIGLLIGASCARLTWGFGPRSLAGTIASIGMIVFTVFYPPGIPLIVTVIKDSFFTYLMFFMFSYLVAELVSSENEGASKVNLNLSVAVAVGALGALFRHNGFILLWGGLLAYLAIRALQKKMPSRKNLYIVFSIFAVFHLTSFLLDKVVADKSMNNQGFSFKNWTIRADYSLAYILKEMDESDVRNFEETVSLKNLNLSADDTYLFNLTPQEYLNQKTEVDFFAQAEDFLFKNPKIWMKVKWAYSEVLLTKPISHGMIFSGDLTNTKAQVDMNRFQENSVKLKMTDPRQNEFIQRLSEKLGIGSDANVLKDPQFFTEMWNFAIWLKYFVFALVALMVAEVVSAKNFVRFFPTFAFLSTILFFLWTPYLLMSFANQSRYYFLTVLVSKIAIIAGASATVRMVERKLGTTNFFTLIGTPARPGSHES